MSAVSLYEKCHAFGWLPNDPYMELRTKHFCDAEMSEMGDFWSLKLFFYVDYIILHVKKKFAVVGSTHF